MSENAPRTSRTDAEATSLFAISSAIIQVYPNTDPFELAPLILKSLTEPDVRWAIQAYLKERQDEG